MINSLSDYIFVFSYNRLLAPHCALGVVQLSGGNSLFLYLKNEK